MSESVGIIGLGRMGMAAAKRYHQEGYSVVGCDVRQDATEGLKSLGGSPVESAKEVAQRTDFIIIYVLNDQQVMETVAGANGIFEGSQANKRVICMSTIDKETLESIAEQCMQRNIQFVDCPVTGGPARLEAGTLTLIAAAPKDVLEACRPTLEIQGRIVCVGEKPGMGQAAKHCNQLLVGTTLAATAELIVLAKKSGLDPEIVCRIVGSGICGSDYFRLLASSILQNKPSPGGLGQMCKDMGLVMNDARRVEAPLMVLSSAYQYFVAALSLGMGDGDSSDLIKVLERMTTPES